MIQSQINPSSRLALTEVILLAKARKDLSFAQITDGTGLSEAFVTAALLGQHPLPKAAATVLGMLTTNPAKALGLDNYGLDNYGLETGKNADLVLVDTQSVAGVILDLPARLKVLKRGKIVATSNYNRSIAF